MQEYCYRSTKKDATKAFLKLLLNKLRKRKLSQMRQRYLSPTSKGGRLTPTSSKKSNDNSDDSSGFHSENSSEHGGERNSSRSPTTDTVDNATAVAAAAVVINPDMNEENAVINDDKLEHTVVRQDEDGKIVSQHQKMFDSIVLHMEEHNNGILEKLKGEKKDGGSEEDCVACLLYTSPSPRDRQKSRMPSSA